MAIEQSFIRNLPQGARQNLSGALNHILDQSEHKIPAEAGAAIAIEEIPEEEIKMLSSAIYQAIRNHRIRIQFTHLRQQGISVEEACKQLGQQIHLHPDYIKNIAYRK